MLAVHSSVIAVVANIAASELELDRPEITSHFIGYQNP
jgi:hypothetical protein